MGEFKDLTGKRFGKLVVIKQDQDYIFPSGIRATTWLCKCDCGNYKTIIGNSLRNGLTKSCGCLIGKHRKIKAEDMIGKRFGLLVVKSMVPESQAPNQKHDYWLCNCDCGTKDYLVYGVALRRKRGTKSCGCYNREMSHIKNTIDISGYKYGHLTVLKQHDGKTDSRGSVLWDCVCDCGNHCTVSSNALRTGNTISCGCVVSSNEERIRKVLENFNIKFKPQYTFDDLRSPITNWLLKYDFGIYNKDNQLDCLIEYDGEQHFDEMRFSPDPQKNKEKYERTLLYDYLKNQYCIKNKIPLFRIDYLEKDMIEDRVKKILEFRRII